MSDKKKVVIALGFFDSVHKGHRKVIGRAVERAEKLGVSSAVFTFKGNLKKAVGKEDGKFVYGYFERERLIKDLGADEIFFAPVDKKFLSMNKTEFLDFINGKYEICGYVSGKDYRFGFDGGEVKDLNAYAKAHGQFVDTVDTEDVNGRKISTTDIKNLLSDGKVKEASVLLVVPYFITGEVVAGRREGRRIGFPTLNVIPESDKFIPEFGVYSGRAEVDGKEYKAVINCGNCPTFGVDKTIVEAHLIGFDGNAYGKTVKLSFTDRLRDIKKFDSVDELKKTIEKDIQNTEKEDND